VFEWIQQQGNISNAEMLRTFNQGVGMVLLAAPAHAAAVRRQLEATGEAVFDLGRVVANSDGQRVRYQGA